MQHSLPALLYPEVAPLGPTLADYLFERYCLRLRPISPEMVVARLVADISELRRSLTIYFDSFIHNQQRAEEAALRDSSEPPIRKSLQFTTELVRATAVMNANTWNDWIRRGLIRMESKGHPNYDSAVALCIFRRLNDEKRHSLPNRIPRESWYCYIQLSRHSSRKGIKIEELAELAARHPGAFASTRYAGARWRREEGWQLVGRHQGAVTFAGHKQHGYTLPIENVLAWEPALEPLYHPLPGREDDALQTLAGHALTLLADEYLP